MRLSDASMVSVPLRGNGCESLYNPWGADGYRTTDGFQSPYGVMDVNPFSRETLAQRPFTMPWFQSPYGVMDVNL